MVMTSTNRSSNRIPRLLGKGTNVGLPYNGSAPDLGAFDR